MAKYVEADEFKARVADLEREGKWSTLVQLLQSHSDQAAEPGEKVKLLLQLSAIYRDQLKLDVMVLNTLRELLELAPGHCQAVELLEAQLRRMKRWNDLVDHLRQQAGVADDSQRGIELYLEIARLFTERFANRAEARKALEQALKLDPAHPEARRQLEQLDAQSSPPTTRGATSRAMVALLLLASAGALVYFIRAFMLP